MYGINSKGNTRWRVIIKRSESASLLVSERVQIALRAFRQRRNIARSAAVQTVGEQRVCHAVALRRIPYTLRVIPYQSFGLDRKKQVFRLAFFLSCLNNFEPLIPMRNLIFLSHSFLIESDIRTFSAFQDQSSAVLSMCINRLKVTSCGF